MDEQQGSKQKEKTMSCSKKEKDNLERFLLGIHPTPSLQLDRAEEHPTRAIESLYSRTLHARSP
jgi:hypothetical protein